MLFLTERDVMDALSGGHPALESVELIEEMMRQQSAGSTFQLKRSTMTHPDHPGHLWHNIRILPGMVPGMGAAAVRVYSGYRGTNRSEVICLFDWETMQMVSILSDYHLHAIRTASPYGVAAKHLAREDASSIGIIGSGRYARAMTAATCAVRPIRRVKVYSRDPAKVRDFCEVMQHELGIEVEPARSGREAVRGTDVMITATSGNVVVFESGWLEPGALLMSLAPGEFDAETILRSRVFLSSTEQVLGDDPPRKPFSTVLADGRFRAEDVCAELCDVVAGKKPGRETPEDIIVYESPGMGILDAAIGHWVHGRAKQKGLGTELPFGEALGGH
ncbi:MAG: ornithine cyclodeaminase family protein [Rhodocyclaceae bacterium]|nr:ornithine cyclodeaminase family protein [Rhodocyclaceae bacterium]MCA4903541.1 ornithine cyclodeaminase family protein [Rhodocyclaceae bacterium]